jgi:hypothetical protein
MFAGRRFVIVGFDAASEESLRELTERCGGTVLPASGGRGVPDYGVVPIFGCPLTRTVTHVVTNAWLVSDTSFSHYFHIPIVCLQGST